jgi:hypothetical protein
VLKKTFAIGGLAIATATGAILTASPSSAQVPTWGGGGCCGGSFTSNHFRHFTHHRNFNFTENDLFNHIPIRIRNRNNNVAIARNDQAQAQRENQDQDQFQRLRERRREERREQPQQQQPVRIVGAPGV